VAVVCALLCRRALPRAHLLLDARGVPGAAPSLGSASRIGEVAAQIQGEDFEERLRGIHRWMEGHLEDVPEESYQWHTFDEIVDSGRYGGCAAHSLVYGSLTRALGIPTVWVKSMDVDWIRAFRAGPEPQTWSGHVFLEVHDGERWVLLDAQGQTLYTEYDPRMRLLSGDRYAYDKGGDPRAGRSGRGCSSPRTTRAGTSWPRGSRRGAGGWGARETRATSSGCPRRRGRRWWWPVWASAGRCPSPTARCTRCPRRRTRSQAGSRRGRRRMGRGWCGCTGTEADLARVIGTLEL
jgi:hypothetical protein